MSSAFDRDQHGPQNQLPSRLGANALNNDPRESEFEPDPYSADESTVPPRGLMRNRRHPIVWLGLALLLGGLIALFLAAIVTG